MDCRRTGNCSSGSRLRKRRRERKRCWLFENPMHPYTIGLMNSVPDLEEEREYLETIPGAVPLPNQMPKGCRFAPRCPRVMPVCEQKVPELVQTNGHKCRCWLYAEGGDAK